jgi:hypothetical protein
MADAACWEHTVDIWLENRKSEGTLLMMSAVYLSTCLDMQKYLIVKRKNWKHNYKQTIFAVYTSEHPVRIDRIDKTKLGFVLCVCYFPVSTSKSSILRPYLKTFLQQ